MEKQKIKLSEIQKGIYFDCQFGNAEDYNISTVFSVKSGNSRALKVAIQLVVEEQEALRLTLTEENGQPFFYLNSNIDFEIETIQKLSTNIEQSSDLTNFISAPFELMDDSLFRAMIFKDEDDSELTCVFCAHHIIADGISVGLIQEKILLNYSAIVEEKEILLETDSGFINFIYDENQKLRNGGYKNQKLYWGQTTKTMKPISLVANYQSKAHLKRQSKEMKFDISDELYKRIKLVSQKLEITPFHFLMSNFYLLVHLHTSQETITLTTPFSHRPHFDLFETIGCFIYTLPIQIEVNKESTFESLALALYQKMIECYKNTGYPNNLIARDAGMNVSGTNVFDYAFVYDHYELSEEINCDYSNIFPEKVTFPGKMMSIFHESLHGKSLRIQYKSNVFSEAFITDFGQRYLSLLDQALNNTDKKVGDFVIDDMHNHKNESKMTCEESQYTPIYEDMKSFITDRLRRFPNQMGLVSTEKTYTCSEIDQKSNFLAQKIIEHTKKRESAIGILMSRSPELIIAVYAVIKSGNYYIPLDENYPGERMKFIVEDADISLCITDKIDLEIETKTLFVNTFDEIEEASPVGIQRTPDQLLYIEYTSGSTGKPKGVMIEDRCALNVITDLERHYPVEKDDVYCFKTAFTFDISATEIFGWIAGEGRLFILGCNKEKDPLALIDSIVKNKITHINFVPTMFRLLLETIDDTNRLKLQSLKWIFVGGEAVSHETIEKYLKLGLSARLENVYGPTECTMWASRYPLSSTDESLYVPIGKPLNRNKFYVVDSQLKRQPIGVPGELCIAGIQVARGYLNREKLNAIRFIKNPFSNENLSDDYKRMYRTGDLVRQNHDGNYEFLGRIDDQVKLNGLRIELGEIESQIESVPGVVQAVVILKGLNNSRSTLCAFYTGVQIEDRSIRLHLQKFLPIYMIPSIYYYLEAFPLNKSDKVDKKALKNMFLDRQTDKAISSKPKTTLQKQIFDVWVQVLGINHFGIDDVFTDIGGHSIAIVQLHRLLQIELEIVFSITDLFVAPTIRKFAEKIDEQTVSSNTDTIRREKKGRTFQYEDIAIVGMSINVPGATNVEEFWDNLLNERESIHFYSDSELDALGIEPSLYKQSNYIRAKGRINDLDYFDSRFFEYSPVEVKRMSPQMRILYRGAWEAFENSGYTPDTISGKTGMFIGGSDDFDWYKRLLYSNDHFGEVYDAFTLSTNHFLATRLAYRLNATGPVYNALTGCSTSLVTVHIACGALMMGECDLALAGGVTVELPNEGGYQYVPGLMFSPDGHCRPFDNRAQGTMFSNGMGLVVLKRASEAYRDDDHIYAVIKGTSINNDGNDKIGFTAPSVNGQVDVMREAYRRSGISPESIHYVEAHGTGTTLGDPIEVQSLTQAFSTNKKQFCALGSVKGNIGHADTAAGIVGLIKAALVVKNNFIPGTVNYDIPNEKIDFEKTPFYVKSKGFHWKGDTDMRAGVNSFGVGGTNAHAILEQPQKRESVSCAQSTELMVLSAKSESALRENVKNILVKLNGADQFGNIGYTLQSRRAVFNHRYAFIANKETFNLNNQLERLEDALIKKAQKPQEIVFLFSGQGSQYSGMTKSLFENSVNSKFGKKYKENILRILDCLDDDTSTNILDVLFEGKGNSINETGYAQLTLFIVEYSMAATFIEMGIVPSVLIGHSIGEVTAATIAGVWSLEQAIKIISMRAELMQKQPRGHMLAIMESHKSIAQYLPERVWLSLENTTNKCCVGAEKATIESLKEKMDALEINAAVLHTSHAFHTPMMLEAADAFTKFMSGIDLNEPKIPIVSNITGEYVTKGLMTNPNYWGEHLVKPVKFEKSLENLLDKAGLFIEVGPGRTLVSFIKQHQMKTKDHHVFNTIRHPKEDKDDYAYLLERLGDIWTVGLDLNWKKWFEKGQFLPLPSYAFDKTYYPIECTKEIELEKERIEVKENVSSIQKNQIAQYVLTAYIKIFGFENITSKDDFFELGGDSLKAASLVAKINDTIHGDVEIADIFAHSRIDRLISKIELGYKEHNLEEKIRPTKLKAYPLTKAQQRMYTLHMLNPKSTSYNLPSVTLIKGTICSEKINGAVEKLMERHCILRTHFAIEGNQVVQKVLEIYSVPLIFGSVENVTDIDRFIAEELSRFVRPFDLEHGPLFRMKILEIGIQGYLMFFDIHHIIADGTSVEILTRDFNALYRGNLDPLEIQYKDYAVWESEVHQPKQKDQKFWKNLLSDDLPQLELPTDRERQNATNSSGGRFYFQLDEALSKRLKAFTKEQELTMYMTLLAAWFILLESYSKHKNITIGTPIAGRHNKQTEEMLGMFVNMLPIKMKVDTTLTIDAFLGQLKMRILECFSHQEYPFDLIVEDLNRPRDFLRNALFDVCFDFQNMTQHVLQFDDMTFIPKEVPIDSVHYDLVLTCQENIENHNLEGFIDYSSHLFNSSTISNLVNRFKSLLNQMVEEPKSIIENLNLETVQASLTQTPKTEISNQSIIAMLVEQVQCYPEKVALILSDNNQITYRELELRICHLADYLKCQGIKQGDKVAVMSERNAYMIISIFSILSLGAIYVPVDPSLAKDRISHMLKTAEVDCVLCEDLGMTESFGLLRISLSEVAESYISAEKSKISALDTDKVFYEQLAYILFTSGSTGLPKGVMVPHCAVLNFIDDIRNRGIFEFKESIIYSLTTPSFDIFIFEAILPIVLGRTIYIASNDEVLDAAMAANKIVRYEITHILSTVSRIKAFVENRDFEKALGVLKFILSGGENYLPKLLQFLKSKTNAQLFNMYGPTETTIWSTTKDLTHSMQISVGTPIKNTNIAIIGQNQRLVPLGEDGEICIYGVGLAKGYVNNDVETALRFVELKELPGTVVYKTGDRGRLLSNGELEIIGRLDNQVKIRGYRVELDEIERALDRFDGIDQCIAKINEKSEIAALCLYYTSGQNINENLIKEHLKSKLPEYMVPSHYIKLDTFPKLHSGKIDKSQLTLNPSDLETLSSKLKVTEGTITAEQLYKGIKQIWCEVLERNRIAGTDNFFDIGGNSLLIMIVNNHLQEKLKLNLPLVDLFTYPTINDLVEHVVGKTEPRIEVANVQINSQKNENNDIAVIGMAMRFPKSRSADEYWENIVQGRELITFLNSEDLRKAGVPKDIYLRENYVAAKGHLDDTEYFDANFFDYSEKEAKMMDPQIRLLHQITWEALETAGYNPFKFDGKIGLFAGSSTNITWMSQFMNQSHDILSGYELLTLNDKDFLTTKVSYKLNLKGPSMNIQTACSTSLVAIHQAKKSLIDGESDIAVAGGVSITYPQKEGYLWYPGMIFSKDGHCRPFSTNSSGTVSGNGCGMVVLKKLSKAKRDRDFIWSVIKGSAVNNDGIQKVGFTAPSVRGQCDVIKAAVEDAKVDPKRIQYIETHGTGTDLGDPIEIQAIKEVYRKTEHPCSIGSIKANIGHLDAAAGVAGFIKAALITHHKQVPPLVNFTSLNEKISFDDTNLCIDTIKREALDDNQYVSVSSFGMGGTNAHFILCNDFKKEGVDV